MYDNLSEFQILLNQIISHDALTDGVIQKDDKDIDKKIEAIKTLAYGIYEHDPIGGKLILMSCLWTKDRLENPKQVRKSDFYKYLQHYLKTGWTLVHKK